MTKTAKNIAAIYLIVAGLFASAFTVSAIPTSNVFKRHDDVQKTFATKDQHRNGTLLYNDEMYGQAQVRSDLNQRISLLLEDALGSSD